MSALKQFEELIESLVEGSLGEAVPGRLHPVEIAKKLARAMESGQTIAADKTLVPNDYTVLVSPTDYAAIEPFRQSLERELVSYLRSLAREREASFVSAPRVSIVADHSLRRRRVRVRALLADVARVTGQEAAFTARLPVAEVQAILRRHARLTLADGRTIPLDKPVISLGRSLDNDVVIEDKRVSRRHAQIRLMQDAFCLYDLASANGTMVNGQEVDQTVLRNGDVISLGGVECRFQAGHRETKHGA